MKKVVIGSKNKFKQKVWKSFDWFKKTNWKRLWLVQKTNKKKLEKVVIGLRGRAAARSGLPTPLGDPTIHFCQRTFAKCHFLFVFVFVLLTQSDAIGNCCIGFVQISFWICFILQIGVYWFVHVSFLCLFFIYISHFFSEKVLQIKAVKKVKDYNCCFFFITITKVSANQALCGGLKLWWHKNEINKKP